MVKSTLDQRLEAFCARMKLSPCFKAVQRGSTIAILREDLSSRLEALDVQYVPDLTEHTGLTGRGSITMLQGVALDGSQVLVRHSKRGGLLGRVIPDVFLGRCRPFRELLLAEKARQCAVPTAEVVGAVRRRAFGPFYRGAVYTKELRGTIDLLSYLRAVTQDRDAASLRGKRYTLREAGRIVRLAHDAGLYHADLQLKNILVRNDEKTEIFLIDLDKARWYKRLPNLLRMMNLLRLTRSATKAVRSGVRITRTDMVRFLQGYIGADGVEKCRLYWRAPFLKPVYKLKWALSDALYRVIGQHP